MVRGLEETAVNDLISPPSGAPLISALGDVGGFRHTDLTKVPPMMFTQPNFTSTTSLDFAETDPDTVVRAGNLDSGPHIAFSTDNGAHWFAGTDPSGVSGGGTVAAAADGSRFVWSPQGAGVHHTTGFGTSWSASSGIPAGAVVESDRVDPKTFYGFKSGKFYVSTDGGATFTASAATGLPAGDSVRFKALPGAKGDIWLAGGASDGPYGLWHSTDSGATFTKLPNVDEADTVGFGKAAPGASYQTLFTSAEIDGVRGVFRSTDRGATWTRVNDDAHQWGWTGAAITGRPAGLRPRLRGDQRPRRRLRRPLGHRWRHGSGRARGARSVGRLRGDLQGHQPLDRRLPGRRPAHQHGLGRLERLVLNWSFANGQKISQLWNGSPTQSGGAVTVRNTDWNGTVAAGSSVAFGFNRDPVRGEQRTDRLPTGRTDLRGSLNT
ncbi:hypothetical protein GCM10023238_17850 [Streptomyces heliomycini]